MAASVRIPCLSCAGPAPMSSCLDRWYSSRGIWKKRFPGCTRSNWGLSMSVIMAGLPGTGKSTLARALAQRLPGAVLDKDLIRAALFEPAHVEYSLAQDDFCQEVMLETAGYLLAKEAEAHILLDGRTFSRRYQRERVMEFCRKVGTTWAVLECVCAEQTALARL